MKKYFVVSVGILLLVAGSMWRCKNHHRPKQNLFSGHRYNSNTVQGLFLDSISLYGYDADIIRVLDSLLTVSDESGRSYLMARKASILSKTGNLDETKKIITKEIQRVKTVFDQIAIYDYQFHTQPDSVDVDILKNFLLSENEWFPKVSLLNRIGQYYKDVDFNLDSARHYFVRSASELNKNPYLTTEHFICYESLATLAPSMRRHLEGIMYANFLCDFTRYLNEPPDLVKARAYLTRANMLFREGDVEGFHLDDLLARNFIDSARHVKEYQQFLKNELVFLYVYPERDTLIEDFLFKLEKSVKSSGQDHFNFKRLKGNILLHRQKYADAIQYLKPAYDIEMKKTFFNPRDFSNVCYCLKECYLQLKDYNAALQYIDLNEKYIGGRKKSSIKKNVFSFTNDLERAKIFLNKYKSYGNPKDLYNVQDYLGKVDKKMIAEYKVSDEQSILQFYLESGVTFLYLGIETAFQLYELTKDKQYIQQYIDYTDRKKSSLMYRDMKAITAAPEKSSMEDEKLIKVKTNIKEEMLKGCRDNNRFNLAVQKFMDIEEKLLQQNGQYVQKDDLGVLTKNKIEDIQKMLTDDDVILDIFHHGNNIFYLFLKKGSTELKKISLSDSNLETADRFLTEIQKSASSGLQTDTLVSILFPFDINTAFEKNITIIPDGIFHRLSVPALLGAKYNITYLPALKFKDFTKNGIKDSGNKVSIFAFSDPQTIMSVKRTSVIELPGTYKESISLQKKYPDAHLFAGIRATKKNFIKAYTDPKTEYIHLAVHGIANSDKKEDVKLYFRTSDGGLDSLYGYELLRHKSKVKKIVLSACESAKGRYIEGEGNYTLARYFIINGATEVVSSVHLLADDSWMGNAGMIRYVVR